MYTITDCHNYKRPARDALVVQVRQFVRVSSSPDILVGKLVAEYLFDSASVALYTHASGLPGQGGWHYEWIARIVPSVVKTSLS